MPAVGGNDPCSRNAAEGAWIKPSIVIGHVFTPPEGDEKMRLKGSFHIGTDVPALKPVTVVTVVPPTVVEDPLKPAEVEYRTR